MFPDNNWYGHRYVLSNFCEVKDSPSYSNIQHGWYKNFNFKHGQRKLISAPFLCWNKRIYDSCKINSIQNVSVIGSPFLYLNFDEIKNYNILKTKSKGTIFFPAHSAPRSDLFMFKGKNPETNQRINHNIILDEIEKKFPPPYQACIYFSDYEEKNILIYKERGWETVCLGNRSNIFFLEDFVKLVTNFDFVVCSDLNTAAFYSMYLKRKVRVMFEVNNRLINSIENNFNKHNKEIFYKNYPELYDEYLDSDTGYKLAKEELGFYYKKNKSELIKLLGWDKISKKILSKFLTKLIDIKYGKLRY